MKCFTFPLVMLCVQLVFPLELIAQPDLTIIPPLVDSLIDVSRSHTAATEFEAAYAASSRAGEVATACCGERSAAYAAYCFNEGRIRYFQGENREAVPWYLQAKELRAELFGTSHPEYGKSLNNLAVVYDVMGEYARAETLYREVLALREKTTGKQSKAYSDVLNNLATLYDAMGDYEKAEQMNRQALAIRKQLFGASSSEYFASLQALGNVYYHTSNYARALPIYLQVKEHLEAQESLDFYRYVGILNNLGAVYMGVEDYENAELNYAELVDLREQVIGKENLAYATEISHLGVIYHYTGRLEASEAYLLESLQILAKLDLEKTLEYAYTLQYLSELYRSKESLHNSLTRQEEAGRLLSELLHPNHPRYLRSVVELVDVEIALGKQKRAAKRLKVLADLEEKNILNAARHLGEEEMGNFMVDFQENLDRYLSLAAVDTSLTTICYDKLLHYKGFLLSRTRRIRDWASDDTNIQELQVALVNVHDRLADRYADADASTAEITTLEEESYQLEKELVRSSADFREQFASVLWTDVRRTLAPTAAAVEFFVYDNKLTSEEGTVYLGAMLLLPNAERPVFLTLCPETRLKELLTYKAEKITSAYINDLYAADAKGKLLYELIWAPLEAVLKDHPHIKDVHYAASGTLHRLNLAALPADDNRLLGQKYFLTALGSTRTLATRTQDSTADSISATGTAILYGGINYGAPDANVASPARPENLPESRRRAYPIQRGYDPENGYWQSLPWTEVEVRTAEELLRAAGYAPELRTANAADEAGFKALGTTTTSPHLLHLATHGFFFPDATVEAIADSVAFRTSARAMIRSGLVLADGNYAWANGRPRTTADEDGILTAYEVSRLNLRNTELVILSACETGLGEINGTEGVYGLQRAFKMAGARYLIMTLWQVPDFQAQAFMTTFYLAWLEEGKSIPTAFRTARNYMRARYGNAYDWAGFVLLE